MGTFRIRGSSGSTHLDDAFFRNLNFYPDTDWVDQWIFRNGRNYLFRQFQIRLGESKDKYYHKDGGGTVVDWWWRTVYSCTRVTSNEDGLNSEDSCLKRESLIESGVKDLCLQGVRTSKVVISQEVKS